MEIPVTAHLPVEYISSERLRLDIYRRMAESKDDKELDEIRDELVDRFGELPDAALTLMEVAKIRNYAKSIGLTEVVLQGKFLKLLPITLPESAQLRVQRVYPGSLIKNQTNTVMVAYSTSPSWRAGWQEGGEIGNTSAWVMEVLRTVVTKN